MNGDDELELRGITNDRSRSGLGSGWSMSGIWRDPVGDMAMVCLFSWTFKSRDDEPLDWRGKVGAGGMSAAHSFSARSEREWKLSWDWLRAWLRCSWGGRTVGERPLAAAAAVASSWRWRNGDTLNPLKNFLGLDAWGLEGSGMMERNDYGGKGRVRTGGNHKGSALTTISWTAEQKVCVPVVWW